MRRRLWLVFVLAGLVEGGGALWLVLTSNHENQALLTSVLGLFIGWAFIFSGSVATLRRPENRTGLLLALVGIVWFLGALSDSNNSVAFTVGLVLESLVIASFVHLLLAYPRGTLDSGLERGIVGAAYALTLGGPALYLLFREQQSSGCTDCPPNELFLSNHPLAADIVNIGVDVAAAALLGLAVLVLVRRWHSASKVYRRSLRTVLSAGALALVCFLLALAAEPVSHTLSAGFSIGAGLAAIAVPFFFLAGLHRGRFAAGAMGRLVVELGRTPEPSALRDAFRTALHDPTLQLAYWLPEAHAYVDAEGRFFEPPEGRSTTIVNDDEGPIATLVHDPSLDDEPELVESAVAAARLAILNERFQAELRARVNELEQERDFTRLVVDSTPALFCVIDPDGRIVRYNRSLEDLSGHPDDDKARGRFFWELFSLPERADEDRAALAAAAAGLETGRRQSLLPSPHGDRLVEWLDVRFADEQGQLRFLLEAGLDVTEREQNLADVRRLADEQAALRRVAEVVAGGPSEEELMASVIAEAALLLGAQSAHMVRYEPDDMLRLMGRWNAPGSESIPMADGLRPLDSQTVVWSVRETGGTVRVDDYENIPGSLAELLRSIGIRASVGAPITVNGRLWGAMAASRTTGEPFEPDAEERLGRFAALAAQAIENAQSRDEITNLAAEQAALRRVATVVASEPSEDELMAVVTEEAGKLLGSQTANLVRYEGADSLTVRGRWNDPSGLATDPLRVLTLDGQTILSRVKAAGAPVRLDTYEGIPGELAEFLRGLGIKSAVAAPITVAGRLWGAMTASRTTDEVFALGAEERLGRFADLAAQAIANAQARREITSLAAEQTALRRVATLVASSPPQEVLFAAVSEEVAGLFGGETANVVRREDDSFRVLGGWANVGAEPVAPGRVFPLHGDGAVHRAMASGNPERIDSRDELRDATMRSIWDELGIRAAIAAPVQVEGRIWGGIAVFRTVDEQFGLGTEERLGDFAALVAQAIANAEAQAQLAASRARIVQATDEARRKLERNLHDGAQQRLVSLSLSLRLAQAKLLSDPRDADAILAAASTELAHALEELRELARGIHPAVLSDRGLGPALQTLAQRSTLPVEIDNAVEERLPGAVEAAAYYVVSESLANVAKYAQASSVQVRISRANGVARVEVADDGIGGADPAQGSGLRGLADRVEALAGRLEVTSTNGGGTVIRAEIPVDTE